MLKIGFTIREGNKIPAVEGQRRIRTALMMLKVITCRTFGWVRRRRGRRGRVRRRIMSDLIYFRVIAGCRAISSGQGIVPARSFFHYGTVVVAVLRVPQSKPMTRFMGRRLAHCAGVRSLGVYPNCLSHNVSTTNGRFLPAGFARIRFWRVLIPHLDIIRTRRWGHRWRGSVVRKRKCNSRAVVIEGSGSLPILITPFNCRGFRSTKGWIYVYRDVSTLRPRFGIARSSGRATLDTRSRIATKVELHSGPQLLLITNQEASGL